MENVLLLIHDDAGEEAGPKGLRKNRSAHLIPGVPVAPGDSIAEISPECDEIVCLARPEPFGHPRNPPGQSAALQSSRGPAPR